MPPFSAGAQWTVRFNGHMPQFTGNSVSSFNESAVRDDSPANSGTDGQVKDILVTAAAAEQGFSHNR
jgi:hypothetical protein